MLQNVKAISPHLGRFGKFIAPLVRNVAGAAVAGFGISAGASLFDKLQKRFGNKDENSDKKND